jgi:hypothetical protein
MRELSHDDAHWKPAPDRFSVDEVLAHLSHSEGHCYRMRVDQLLNEELPGFEQDDAQMYLDLYRDADGEDSFDHFEEQLRDQHRVPAHAAAQCRRPEGQAQSRGRDHAPADAA